MTWKVRRNETDEKATKDVNKVSIYKARHEEGISIWESIEKVTKNR